MDTFNTLIIQNNTLTKNRGEVKCKRVMFFFFLAAECGTPLVERETNGGMRRENGWGRVIQSHRSTLVIQPLDGFFFSLLHISSPALLPTCPSFPTCLCAPCHTWRLWQDSGDEIVKPLGVLLWVHCGDLRSGLQRGHADNCQSSHAEYLSCNSPVNLLLINSLSSFFWSFKWLLYTATYPVFDSLGGVGSFLLGIVMLKDVYNSHEVHLLPGSSCSLKQTPLNENLYICTVSSGKNQILLE